MPSETTTACASLLVFFRIRRGTFPYSVEDDASTISQTPTTYYANTCVKLTIVTHLSLIERIAIANLFLFLSLLCPVLATMSFATYFLVRSLLSAFLPCFFLFFSFFLLNCSRFDLICFRLSRDHGWIRSGSVNVR